ncbi:MAG: hydroxymethylbilane synthase [Peptoniphilaceae bacterium]|nr:hydroxymethylbilane synthase [Peptoniphilaceae bacterium]MDY6019295.1 hydroxymethylbilane synthase [Anaerococcus sp.]
MKIKIGTRSSKLALIQAVSVKDFLEKEGYGVELVKITTSGDKILDRPIDKIGGNGVFSREIEKKLINKEIDLAVHSLKDLPSILPDTLELLEPLKAADPRDVFVGKKIPKDFSNLEGKIIATSSVRRKFLLESFFKGITIKSIRGNIDTRLEKVKNENMDGAIFAKAGLDRLKYDFNYLILDPKIFIPAPCQGILGIEIRKEDTYLMKIFEQNKDPFSSFRMKVERTFQKELSATCSSPIGIYTELMGDKLNLYGCYKSDFDENLKFSKVSGKASDGILLAKTLAKNLRS